MRLPVRLVVAIALAAAVASAAPAMDAEAGRQARPARIARTRLARQVTHRVRAVVRAAAGARTARPLLPRRVVDPYGDPIAALPPPPRGKRRIVFGVMGGAGEEIPPAIDALMEALGARIARRGHVTLTGACPGLPESAARGARRQGGLTVGISSYRSVEEHLASGSPSDFDVMQVTELPAAHRGQDRPNYMGREIDNIERSDVVIVAGGRFGTLGELAIALEEQRPIGVLTGTGGIADIVEQIVSASTRAGKPPGAPVIYDPDPARLVARLEKAHADLEASGGRRRGPLGDGFRVR